MRIASYLAGDQATWGVIRGERISDASAIPVAPATLLELLASSEPARWLDRLAQEDGVAWRELATVTLLAPIPRPAQDLIALGLNYSQHVTETASATTPSPPKLPILFGKAASSVVGPDAEILIDPAVTREVDWEVELAVVIGRAGRGIADADALEHVFGYTVANDVSARDLQFLDGGQWYRGKSLDTFCPLGPWIVTRDELGDAGGRAIALRVNGVEKQRASTSDLIFGVAAIVASASRGRTLRPGDVILTGTPGGVGFTRVPPQFLRDGDVVEAEIEGIGVLRNRVRELPHADPPSTSRPARSKPTPAS